MEKKAINGRKTIIKKFNSNLMAEKFYKVLINDNKTFKNKKVIVTGHTGFKGSWLTAWLVTLGAKVIGISKSIPTKPLI